MNLFKTVLNLILPILKSDKKAKILSISVLGTDLVSIGLTVGFNKFRTVFMDSFQKKSFPQFSYAIGLFCTLALFWILVRGYNAYFKRWLSFIVREKLYVSLLSKVKDEKNVVLLEQRVTQDLDGLSTMAINLFSGMVDAFVKLPIFIYIMLQIAPVWMLGIAFIWVFVGNTIAKRISKPLILLNYEQEAREAILRRDLLGWTVGNALPSLTMLKRNWNTIMNRAKKLGFFQSGFMQISVVLPHIILAKSYFYGNLTLGVLWSTADAFKTIIESLEYFIEKRDDIAKFQAIVNRVKEIK